MLARPNRSRFKFVGIAELPGAGSMLPKMLLPMAFVGVEFEAGARTARLPTMGT
jgi:hypothetical protein